MFSGSGGGGGAGYPGSDATRYSSGTNGQQGGDGVCLYFIFFSYIQTTKNINVIFFILLFLYIIFFSREMVVMVEMEYVYFLLFCY